MQIVINISEEDYRKVKDGRASVSMMRNAIRNGTVLSKGHGRLGDLDKLERDMKNGINAGLLMDGYEDYTNINSVDDCVFCVECADTVLEADKEDILCQ